MSATLTQDSQLEETKPLFWKRQFAARAPTPQVIFDGLFGIAAPIFCFVP
jgi:hypothetical protein